MDAPARTKHFAKALRRSMSLPEVLVWREVRGARMEGQRMRRQHPIGPWILDFYCDRAKLAVEIDGDAVHGFGDAPERDEARDAWLARRGVLTLRIPAADVFSNLDGVIETILHAVARRLGSDSQPAG